LLVVIGHCTYFQIITDFGGCDYSQYFNEDDLITKLLMEIVRFIYVFHMPLFMGLSGALFRMGIQNNRYKTLKPMVISKWKRLMIPFVAVTFLYSVPLKYLSGYYKYSDNLFWDIIAGQLFLQGNSHLWYCMTLFAIMIIAFILKSGINLPHTYKVIILLGMYFVSFIIKIQAIKLICQYLLWFYIGYGFETKREYINVKISLKKTWCHMMVLGVLYVAYRLLPANSYFFVKVSHKLFGILVTCIACLSVYEIAYIISRKTLDRSIVYKTILSDSFGIYLYSDTWNYVILAIAIAVLKNGVLETGEGFLMMFFMRLCITLGLSILITELVKRVKIEQ